MIKRIGKFCRDWQIGIKEIMQFVGMILTISLVYIMLLLIANIYSS